MKKPDVHQAKCLCCDHVFEVDYVRAMDHSGNFHGWTQNVSECPMCESVYYWDTRRDQESWNEAKEINRKRLEMLNVHE